MSDTPTNDNGSESFTDGSETGEIGQKTGKNCSEAGKNCSKTVEDSIESEKDEKDSENVEIESSNGEDESADSTPADRHAARAALYSAAAGAFCYPDDETLAELTHDETVEGIRSAAETLDLEAEAEAVITALDSTDADDLESAYNELFGLPGDGGTYPVVPYEAEYTVADDVGRQQRRIATVVGLLEAFGVEPAAEFDERQDHVVVELELLQVLAARRAVAHEQDDAETVANLERAEAVVLDEHVGDFVPAFAHEVRRSTDGDVEGESAVYRAAADLAESLVTRDLADHPEPDPDIDAASEVRFRA